MKKRKRKFVMHWRIVISNKSKCFSTKRTVGHFLAHLILIIVIVLLCLETPIWVFMQIAPITNERDTVVLYLCTFTDITALKQPIESEDTKGGLSKFARIAKSVTRNRSILMNFAAPNNKSIGIDPTKTTQLPNVGRLNLPHTHTLRYLRVF